jgi:hypothetical protein
MEDEGNVTSVLIKGVGHQGDVFGGIQVVIHHESRQRNEGK